ncbi:MAG: hypothetical protein HC805_06050 [Alkalinema sp. RL_2_19]|nr:hypothetical protein [Alkalinema sp. RL_2_19]
MPDRANSLNSDVLIDDLLGAVLAAAALAPGNRSRFLQAQLIDPTGQLVR